ncbi:integral membrane protein 2B [Agrilus planipennis]|uniref:Integral membrane protein 2 n=1 Tax=Agrilus planipennis TaxID=224129 RepID=A0A1W4XVX8_AGRPL|nr:integral membrane protein 2B [Agrilus planipennis]
MTIITKPLSEKKPTDKLEVPLVTNETLDAPQGEDVEAGSETAESRRRFVILHARARRVSTTTTLLLSLTALTVVGVGIIGGTYLYRQFLRSQLHFRGWCNIPYNSDGTGHTAMIVSPDGGDNELSDSDLFRTFRHANNGPPSPDNNLNEYFQESFELDLDDDVYEKIDVPDFREGRSGRFIHDFNTNLTGIVDLTGKRCFVMPLNRDMVLPPRSLFDLIQKMWDGYYKVDTQVVRETMRVVIPPMNDDDKKAIGSYISKECEGVPVYKLEKYVGGVVKRSADLPNDAKFAQFSGRGIVEFDIVNFEEAMNSLEKITN